MRFTGSMVRELAFSPATLSQRLSTVSRSTFGNPQRSWLEGAWGDYFGAGRISDRFRDGLARRIRNSKARLKDRYAPAAIELGDRFLEWDRGESESPAVVFPRIEEVVWADHTFAIGLHLVYVSAE